MIAHWTPRIAAPIVEDEVETATALPRTDLSVDDPVARLMAMLQSQAELSAALTITRKAARWRGLAAAVLGGLGFGYAAFDAGMDAYRAEDKATAAVVEREAATLVERVDATEEAQKRMGAELDELGGKVDAVAEDVAAIADALKAQPRARRGR